MSTAQLLRAWADDLYLHGSALARWITDYIDLEESLAVGSMAQEDVAHAARLLELCDVDPQTRDGLIYTRPAEEWTPSLLTSWAPLTWPETVARAFMVGTAFACLVDELVAGGQGPVGKTARVMAAEQRLHVRHWSRWVGILASNPATLAAFEDALGEATQRAGDMFGELASPIIPDGEADLPKLDVEPLHQRWRERVDEGLASVEAPCASLPERPRPRRAGGDLASLRRTVERLRSVRNGHPDFLYEIHS